MKKIIAFLLTLAMLLSLAACGGDSNKGSAASEAGKDPNHVHQWKDADCENSKTCVDCGQTEGEPLGHDYTEANYQDASTCTLCGAVLAEKLQADMEKYGFTEFMELGVPYDYHTCCNKNPDARTTGQVTVTKYEIVEEAEGYPAKEGYEWRIVEMQALFSEQNAKSYGPATDTNYEDYYDIKLHDDTVVVAEDYTVTYSVSYNGQIMDATEKMESSWSGWHWVHSELKANIRTVTWAFCVPKGYDGVVVGFRDASIEWADGTYLYDYQPEDFLLFRLSNQEETQAAEEDGILAGTYSLYAMEDSGEYIDNATLVSLDMDGLLLITFNGDGTGVMSTEGEEVTFTYDDTTISDAQGFTYGYVLEDGMLKVDAGDGQIFHCRKQ